MALGDSILHEEHLAEMTSALWMQLMEAEQLQLLGRRLPNGCRYVLLTR